MVRYIDFIVPFGVAILIIFFGGFVIPRDPGTKPIDIIAAQGSMIASWIALYYATLRPLFRKPKLKVMLDNWPVPWDDKSSPTIYMRLGVTNIGLTAAKNCVGRLVRMKNQDKEDIRIDPVYFFWARQDDEVVPFSPIDIFGNHDKSFLDIAKYDPLESLLRLRISQKN